MGVHKSADGTCVISTGGVWQSERYEDEMAAKLAFNLSKKDKADLQKEAYKSTGGLITRQSIKDRQSRRRGGDT